MVRTSWIVPKGIIAITLWPFGIFVSDVKYLTNIKLLTHERTHWEQQKELGGILFYVLYLIEWIIKIPIYGRQAYQNLAAERESNLYENHPTYLSRRKRYAWLKYIFINPTY